MWISNKLQFTFRQILVWVQGGLDIWNLSTCSGNRGQVLPNSTCEQVYKRHMGEGIYGVKAHATLWCKCKLHVFTTNNLIPLNVFILLRFFAELLAKVWLLENIYNLNERQNLKQRNQFDHECIDSIPIPTWHW